MLAELERELPDSWSDPVHRWRSQKVMLGAAAVICMRWGESPMSEGARREWELRALARATSALGAPHRRELCHRDSTARRQARRVRHWRPPRQHGAKSAGRDAKCRRAGLWRIAALWKPRAPRLALSAVRVCRRRGAGCETGRRRAGCLPGDSRASGAGVHHAGRRPCCRAAAVGSACGVVEGRALCADDS